MKYARIDPVTQGIDIIDIEPELYESLLAMENPKAAYLKPLVIDDQPAPASTQIVIDGPLVIEAACVRQTWQLIDKHPEQLSAEARFAELMALMDALPELQSGTGTTAQRLARIERACACLLWGLP